MKKSIFFTILGPKIGDRSKILLKSFVFQFIYNRPIGESQNFLVLDVQAEIGKMLPPPPDIIRGSVLPNLRSADFIPKKLDRNEYNDLKKITNLTFFRG